MLELKKYKQDNKWLIIQNQNQDTENMSLSEQNDQLKKALEELMEKAKMQKAVVSKQNFE